MLHIFRDSYSTTDWDSDSSDDEAFKDDVENVEFPVSWLAGGSGGIEGTKPKLDGKCDPHFMLYLVDQDELALVDQDELADARSSSEAGPEVDLAVVPQNLPEDLVEAVLLRLPVATQARCRAVWKKWLAMLSNPDFARRSFLQSLSQMPSPLCAITYCRVANSYNPHSDPENRPPILPSPRLRTLKVDLSFLPEVFHFGYMYCSPCGFMCIASGVDGEGTHLCVVNPVNNSFKVLPMLHKLQGFGIILLMETKTATESIPSFKVYVRWVKPIGDSDSSQRFDDIEWSRRCMIYSSISGEWKGFLRGQNEAVGVVACNGGLYTTLNGTLPLQLVQLSTERGPRYLRKLALPVYWKSWVKHPEDEYSLSGEEYCLVGYRGRLMCCHCDGIWMLHDARGLWAKIAGRCPRHLLPPKNPETSYLLLKNVHVAGDLVIFLYRLSTWFESDESDVDCPVGYDMLGGFWRKVPQLIAQGGIDVFEPMPDLRL